MHNFPIHKPSVENAIRKGMQSLLSGAFVFRGLRGSSTKKRHQNKPARTQPALLYHLQSLTGSDRWFNALLWLKSSVEWWWNRTGSGWVGEIPDGQAMVLQRRAPPRGGVATVTSCAAPLQFACKGGHSFAFSSHRGAHSSHSLGTWSDVRIQCQEQACNLLKLQSQIVTEGNREGKLFHYSSCLTESLLKSLSFSALFSVISLLAHATVRTERLFIAFQH